MDIQKAKQMRDASLANIDMARKAISELEASIGRSEMQFAQLNEIVCQKEFHLDFQPLQSQFDLVRMNGSRFTDRQNIDTLTAILKSVEEVSDKYSDDPSGYATFTSLYMQIEEYICQYAGRLREQVIRESLRDMQKMYSEGECSDKVLRELVRDWSGMHSQVEDLGDAELYFVKYLQFAVIMGKEMAARGL